MSVKQRIVFFDVILHVWGHHLPIINIEIEDLTRHVLNLIPHRRLFELK